MKITANVDTYLKKDPERQAVDLPHIDKVAIAKGKQYEVAFTEQENDDHKAPKSHGHFHIEIGYGAGEWWAFAEHWDLESQVIVETPPDILPEWNTVDWNDFSAPVSKYFKVSEVTNLQKRRIPGPDRNPLNGQSYSEQMVKENVIKIARALDDVREEWGGPLGINSWLRPWPINLYEVGSRSDNHPLGLSVDFRPLDGRSVGELQNWFEREWYNKGRWNGGFGRGKRRGFVHADLNPRLGKRVWNY